MRSIQLTILILAFILSAGIKQEVRAQEKVEGKITLSGAFALYPLAVQWAEEFKKIYPNVKIDISAGGAGKGMTDAISGMVDIGMVSREVYPEELKNGAYPFAVAKDAVVAVANSTNPAINDLLAKGLKKDAVNNIWITGKYKNWSQALATSSRAPIHVYTRSDACGAAEIWAKYLGKKQEDLLGSGVFGDPGLALAVKKDPAGIGFNNIGYAYDFKTKKQLDGIKVIPLDLNDNGKIDPEENFYETQDQIVNAIAQGKYPSPPARELYFVTKGKPGKGATQAFIKWVLTEGQKFVTPSGYINLPKDKLTSEVNKL